MAIRLLPKIAAGLALTALACSESKPTDPGSDTSNTIASITVAPPQQSLSVGDSLRLLATAVNAAGGTVAAQFQWSSSNRLSAWVRTRDLMGGVQLWLRADARSIIRLDNLPSAPVNFDFEQPQRRDDG